VRARSREPPRRSKSGAAQGKGEIDLRPIETRWQAAWEKDRVYVARADPGRPKWFSTVPYPYMNGYQHLGFGTSFLRAEFQSRYRRMLGYNVLHPQGFHCTGLPILGAARRISEKEPKQWDILRNMGIPDREIPKFADPMHWIEVFPAATMEDLKGLGAAVDWTRSFITTPLNPPYDAFVRWQFHRLKDGDFVRRDKHPVIWCPKDQAPIGDHDRIEGEGETPLEYTLLKFPLPDGRFVVAATIRPETVYGQTNLWVDPKAPYVVARVGEERWILNEAATQKLGEQGRSLSIESQLAGADLIGQEAVAPAINRSIPILPGAFIDQGRGTGIVTSVPSDAPDDFVALRDLQRDPALMAQYHLDPERIGALKPLSIIRTPGWGPLPGVEIVERLGIRDQRDREKLEQAMAEVYKSGFYRGVLNENCGPYAGMRVEVAKEEIRKELVSKGQADTMYEPSGEVVCRCTTRAIVKVVEDQWFLAYGDRTWKEKVHGAVAEMELHPEALRKWLDYVVDWLHDWPTTHHRGLGTILPWDSNWVIESLSDSTIYMAYYTIAHVLQGGALQSQVPWAARLDDAFFDYVFFGKGQAKTVAGRAGIDLEVLEELRREFTYWYPIDLRNTGKDLVQNHMAFCLFHHTAIFPEEHWPRGYGVNGWVRLAGRKMSKSRGNTWYIREALREWPADVIRLTVANAGDGLDDPNVDTDFAEVAEARLKDWVRFATAKAATRRDRRGIDAWFLSVLNRSVQAVRAAMGDMNYKTVLRHGYFDLQSAWSWYLRRSEGRPQTACRKRFVDVQTLILAPFTPHVAEEIWHRTGGKGFVLEAPYPQARTDEIDPRAEAAESLLQSTLADIREILKVTGIVPKRLAVYTTPAWKARVHAIARSLAKQGSVPLNVLMEKALAEPGMRERAKEVAAYAKQVADDVKHARLEDLERFSSVDEFAMFRENARFLGKELGVKVDVDRADDPHRWDPSNKAERAIPGRPAIYLE
jgi:leucyl-tRNA synthetase